MSFEVDASSYKITVNVGENGSVLPNPSLTVSAGSSQILQFVPNSGFRVLDVKIDGVSKGAITSWLFKNMQKNYLVVMMWMEGL